MSHSSPNCCCSVDLGLDSSQEFMKKGLTAWLAGKQQDIIFLLEFQTVHVHVYTHVIQTCLKEQSKS